MENTELPAGGWREAKKGGVDPKKKDANKQGGRSGAAIQGTSCKRRLF